MLPGWYGFGSAVETWIAEHPEQGMPFLQELYREWAFFRSLLSNMDMVLAKSSIAIASRYAEMQHPGLVRLPAGARVADALAAAGGPAAAADLDRVNLAQPLADGVRVLIPERGLPGAPDDAGGGKTAAPASGPDRDPVPPPAVTAGPSTATPRPPSSSTPCRGWDPRPLRRSSSTARPTAPSTTSTSSRRSVDRARQARGDPQPGPGLAVSERMWSWRCSSPPLPRWPRSRCRGGSRCPWPSWPSRRSGAPHRGGRSSRSPWWCSPDSSPPSQVSTAPIVVSRAGLPWSPIPSPCPAACRSR